MPIQKGISLERLDSARIFSKSCMPVPSKPGLWRNNGNAKWTSQTVIMGKGKLMPHTAVTERVTFQPSRNLYRCKIDGQEIKVIPLTYNRFWDICHYKGELPKGKNKNSTVPDIWLRVGVK